MWGVMRRSESYSIRVKYQINNIDDYVLYTHYMSYLDRLVKSTYGQNTHYNCDDTTYSFCIVRLYISRWHVGRHIE